MISDNHYKMNYRVNYEVNYEAIVTSVKGDSHASLLLTLNQANLMAPPWIPQPVDPDRPWPPA